MSKRVLIGCGVLLVSIGIPYAAALAQNSLKPAEAKAGFDRCLQTCRNNQTECNKASSIPQYILACNDNFLRCANICSATYFR